MSYTSKLGTWAWIKDVITVTDEGPEARLESFAWANGVVAGMHEAEALDDLEKQWIEDQLQTLQTKLDRKITSSQITAMISKFIKLNKEQKEQVVNYMERRWLANDN